MKKKLIALAIMGALSLTALVGCAPAASSDGTITVVSRESGSGTRGAFIELLGIEEKDADGNNVDDTTKEAIIANKTDVMITQISGNKNSIGYISLGSLNDTVKAVKVDGVEATVENIKNNTYKVSRPFQIATKGEATGIKADFIKYIMSKEGQKVITDNKYIAINDAAEAFTTDNSEGKLVIAGSSSVTPVMEKLVEAYKAINSKATIEVQQSDSTTGIKETIDGTADIGMASRELKDTEKAELTPTTIAMDGIAIIVNKENSVNDLTSANIKAIYTDGIKDWKDIK